MSSTVPMYGNVPGQPCKRCGMPLPPNQVRCPRCGLDASGAQQNPQSLTGGQFPGQNPPGMNVMPNSFPGIPQAGQGYRAPNTVSFQGMAGQSNTNMQYPQQASLPGTGQHFQPTSMPGIGGAHPSSQSFPGITGQNVSGRALPSTPAPGQNMGPVSFAGMAGPGTGNFAHPSASLAGMARTDQPVQPSTPDAASKAVNTGGRRKGRGRAILLTLLLVFMVIVAATSGYVLFTSVTAGKAINQQQPTHVMNPYPTLKVQPLFGDLFRDNSNGWNLDSMAGKYTVKVGGGNLTLQDENNTILSEMLPTSQQFSNFKLMVDAEQTSGNVKNGYGVYIRATPDQQGLLATYYRLELYGDGTYAIFKGTLNASGTPNPNEVKIVSYTPDAAVHKEGLVNHITVVANGSSITFIANNQPLYAFSDSAYTTGSIALFVSNPQDVPAGVVANFSKLAVFPVS